jgi:hypothetical protein
MSDQSLEKSKFDYYTNRVDRMDGMNFYLANREIDMSYLRLTVIIVIIIILMFYLSCAFGLGRAKPSQKIIPGTASSDSGPVLSPEEAAKTQMDQSTGTKISQAPRQEKFSPYVSTSLPDLYRSDASFDYSIPQGRSESRLETIINGVTDKNYSDREDFLFDQAHVLVKSYSQ